MGLGPIIRWVDPPIATGFDYALDPNDSPFASVIVPNPLPGGDGSFMLHFEGNDVPLAARVTFDFTSVNPAGVLAFSIDEIDPAERVDGVSVPFVIGDTHMSEGVVVSLMIKAQTLNAVPTLPALGLGVLGAAVLGLYKVPQSRIRAGAAPG